MSKEVLNLFLVRDRARAKANAQWAERVLEVLVPVTGIVMTSYGALSQDELKQIIQHGKD